MFILYYTTLYFIPYYNLPYSILGLVTSMGDPSVYGVVWAPSLTSQFETKVKKMPDDPTLQSPCVYLDPQSMY